MSRYEVWEPMYNAYQEFARSCLVEDRSLLWPDRPLWTPANVAGLKRALVDEPALGKESFEDKLEIQLANQPPEMWGVLADAYSVYCIVPDTMRPATKREALARLAQRALLPLPDAHHPIWKAIELGFCNPGQRYWQKYREIWFLLILAEQLKQSSNRSGILQDRNAMQTLLDSCLLKVAAPTDRAADMRHALLYLAFPDFYEPIVSSGDKKKILDSFKGRLAGKVPQDMDEALHDIHQVLEKEEAVPPSTHFFYGPLLKPMWRGTTKPPAPPVVMQPSSPSAALGGAVSDLFKILTFTRNVIIYGPPGTGKTYIANQAARALVKQQLTAPVPESYVLQQVVEDNPFYALLALGMHLAGSDKHYSVGQIREFPIMKIRNRSRPMKTEAQTIWGRLQEHTTPESATVGLTDRREPYLFDKDSQGRWYLTEGGRHYVEDALGDTLEALRQSGRKPGDAEDYVTSVAFHQSYSYEDFVEGFRPVGPNEIEIVPGKFREICGQAAANPQAKYVLIIDEINRGNISKIFGELITLLEDDKREGEPGAFAVDLAYSHTRFTIPGNLYIVGTMNTADRSIALLDVALRRRFAFFELLPEPELLHGMTIRTDQGDQLDLEDLLAALNTRISKQLGPDCQIGHSYFMRVNSIESLEFAWNGQILPLLKEYFYSQPDRLAEVLEPYLKGQEEGDFRREGEDLVIALADLARATLP